MGLCQCRLSLNRFFVLHHRSGPPVFGKQTIAIQEQLGDQWSRILGWRERFVFLLG